jgi:hypothetical protein
MQLAILAGLGGAAFGFGLWHFKLLVIFPAFAVTGAFILGVGIANSKSVVCIVLALLVAAVGLQVGYLITLMTAHVRRRIISRFRPNSASESRSATG